MVLQTCRPKELLIGLLEQLEQDDPDAIAESLHLLLNPLQKGDNICLSHSLTYIVIPDYPKCITSSVAHVFLSVLLRLGNRKASSLAMTLSSALDQVAKLPLPHTKEQEEDDIFLLCRCCTNLVIFVRPFVEEVRQNLVSTEQPSDSKVTGGQDSDELRPELLKL